MFLQKRVVAVVGNGASWFASIKVIKFQNWMPAHLTSINFRKFAFECVEIIVTCHFHCRVLRRGRTTKIIKGEPVTCSGSNNRWWWLWALNEVSGIYINVGKSWRSAVKIYVVAGSGPVKWCREFVAQYICFSWKKVAHSWLQMTRLDRGIEYCNSVPSTVTNGVEQSLVTAWSGHIMSQGYICHNCWNNLIPWVFDHFSSFFL